MAKITHEPSGAELAKPLTTCYPPNLRGEEDGAAEVARVNVRNKPPPMPGVIAWSEQKQQREHCESPNQACPPGGTQRAKTYFFSLKKVGNLPVGKI